MLGMHWAFSKALLPVQVPQIVAQLLEFAEVRLVVTGAARHFLELREQLPTCVQVLGTPHFSSPPFSHSTPTRASTCADARMHVRTPHHRCPMCRYGIAGHVARWTYQNCTASQHLVDISAGDDDEWREWREIGDPVMHIELRRWADLMLIAPLSANRSARSSGPIWPEFHSLMKQSSCGCCIA